MAWQNDGGVTRGAGRSIPAAGTRCGAAKLGVRLRPQQDPTCHGGHQHLAVLHSHRRFW